MKRRVNPQAIARVAGAGAMVGQLLVVAADRTVAWAKGYEKGYAAAMVELTGTATPEEGAMFAFASRQLRSAGHEPELVMDTNTEAPRFTCTRCSSSWAPGDDIAPCSVDADAGPAAGDG